MPTRLSATAPHAPAPLPSSARATPPPPRPSTGHASASRFEGGVAARVDGDARLEGVVARSGAPAALRHRVLDRLGRLPADQQARERALVERVAQGPNGARALEAYDEVSRVADGSARARQRLTPELREALVRGVAEPRTPGDSLGEEGVLGARQATTAAQALARMPQARYDEVSGLLARAGSSHAASPSADPQAERALLLSAVAARSPQLTSRGAAGEQALSELTGFAGEVRGMARDELMRTTTARDVDSMHSTSATDPDHPGAVDGRGDNDGLVQRFTDSCAPTAAQLERAELDPVYARQLHREGVSSGATDGAIAAEQARTLRAGGGVVASREADERGRDAITRLHDTLEAAHTPADARHRIGDYLRGTMTDTTALAQVAVDLEQLRASSHGQPTREDVQAIRTLVHAPHGRGMEAEVALNRIAAGAAHSRYHATEAGPHGLTSRQTDDIAARIVRGDDVGLRVTDAAGQGGHFLMATDVRGEGADRRFLVSDPWSGRTTWIAERDLRTQGTPAFDAAFGIGWDRVSTYYHPR